MAKSEVAGVAPTMIIPSGTEIEVDSRGQLSVKTPGNLVIQHSGNYGTIESEGGSIRIESNAEVEAVTVRCAETCYVQGSLTAWRVEAKAIHLEESARANVVLQETQRMQIGRDARLVGNFQSEKELFVLFSRFASQFRALPFFGEREGSELASAEGEKLIASNLDAFSAAAHSASAHSASAQSASAQSSAQAAGAQSTAQPAAQSAAAASQGKGRTMEAAGPAGEVADPGSGDPGGRPVSTQGPVGRVHQSEATGTAQPSAANAPRPGDLPDSLFFSRILLEREFNRGSYGPTSKRVIEELIKLLTDRELEALQKSYTSLFSRVIEPGHDLKRARDLMADFFSGKTGEI